MNTGLVVVILLAPAFAALTLAVLRRGPSALGRICVRGKVWILAAAAIQYLRSTPPEGIADLLGRRDDLLLFALCACGVAFAWANQGSPGSSRRVGQVRWSLAAFASGMLLNAVATVVNGGMPFSVTSARLAGIGEAAIASPPPGHIPMHGGTRLVPLADVVPVPVLHIVFSLGDVLLWLGLAGYLVALARAATDLPGRSAGVSTTSGAAQPTY